MTDADRDDYPFTADDVLDHLRRWKAGELEAGDSPVIQCWLDAASDWLALDGRHGHAYALEGFVGLRDRDPEEILEFFRDRGEVRPADTDSPAPGGPESRAANGS
jgi:hypothetical protein